MTTQTIARLDRTKAPPGYMVRGRFWASDRADVQMVPGIGHLPAKERETAGLSRAWEHYETDNDPPGLEVRELGGGWAVSLRGLVKPGPGVRTVLTGAKPWTLLEARAAAWAYYWRRREVADKLDQPQLVERAMAMPDPRPIWWSRCLAWPDEQVSAVERWLTDGGEMPEVLRA